MWSNDLAIKRTYSSYEGIEMITSDFYVANYKYKYKYKIVYCTLVKLLINNE